MDTSGTSFLAESLTRAEQALLDLAGQEPAVGAWLRDEFEAGATVVQAVSAMGIQGHPDDICHHILPVFWDVGASPTPVAPGTKLKWSNGPFVASLLFVCDFALVAATRIPDGQLLLTRWPRTEIAALTPVRVGNWRASLPAAQIVCLDDASYDANLLFLRADLGQGLADWMVSTMTWVPDVVPEIPATRPEPVMAVDPPAPAAPAVVPPIQPAPAAPGGLITGLPPSLPPSPAPPAPVVPAPVPTAPAVAPAAPAPSLPPVAAPPAIPSPPAPAAPDPVVDDATRFVVRDQATRARTPGMVLAFDNGQRAVVGDRAVVGRQPVAMDPERRTTRVSVLDTTMEISKTHVEIGVDERGYWVLDRGSTNGTELTSPGGEPRPLPADERTPIDVGDRIVLGERWFVVEKASAADGAPAPTYGVGPA